MTLAVRFGAIKVIILYDLMLILSYVCIVILFFGKNFFWDSKLCLLILSIPMAGKLIIDIHKKTGKELNYVLASTINFMRVFFILLMIGIIL